MFCLGIIEESMNSQETLKTLAPFFVHQRMEYVPDDECPVWHTNEYHVPENQIISALMLLSHHIKPSWYAHAFNDTKLYVVMADRYFELSLQKDETWDEMIEYGIRLAHVERRYLENIPLHI